MLPVVVYDVDSNDYELLMETLHGIAERTHVSYSVDAYTHSVVEALDAIRGKNSIFLLISGVKNPDEDNDHYAIRLGRMAMQRNRDNYTVFITRNHRSLEDVICLCIRSAAVMVAPLQKKRTEKLLQQILEDYRRLDESITPENECIVCKEGGTLHRVDIRHIIYVQTLDKKVEICTGQQGIQVYKSMKEMASMLGERFIRCHRCYLINIDKIERINVAAMIIRMSDGSEIPLSRSYKNIVCQMLKEKETTECAS